MPKPASYVRNKWLAISFPLGPSKSGRPKKRLYVVAVNMRANCLTMKIAEDRSGGKKEVGKQKLKLEAIFLEQKDFYHDNL